MKLKKEYLLRQVADTWVVMAFGEECVNFNGMLNLNETGALLWEKLSEDGDIDALVKALTSEYDVSEEEARADAEAFCRKLIEAGCAEE